MNLKITIDSLFDLLSKYHHEHFNELGLLQLDGKPSSRFTKPTNIYQSIYKQILSNIINNYCVTNRKVLSHWIR